jgi:vacuolar iron transporter family protein
MYKSELKNLKNYIFGSTAAIITNICLIVGLGYVQTSKGPILGGLMTIALADNISDSLGIHMYKESEGYEGKLSLLATSLNFFSRLLVSCSFIVIVLMFSISNSIIIAVVWGLFLLTLISYLIARSNKENAILEIIKHLLIAVIVIILSRYVGNLISGYFW